MSNKRYPHLMFSEKIVSLHSKARSFDIMQNKAEYRTSLVSKSLPIAKRLSAIYSFPIAKTIRCVSLDEKKQNEALANIVTLDDIDIERTDAEFFAYLESKKIKTTAKLIKDCRTFFGEVCETAPEVHVIPLDDNSDLVADTNLRDYESIPFKTDIQEYFQNEVLRFAPDAWMDREKDKIGCEFPISKLFYEYQPLRSVEDILADIRALEEDEEQELSSLLND